MINDLYGSLGSRYFLYKLIFTVDITSLYTIIPNDEGLRALKHFFDQRTYTQLLIVTLTNVTLAKSPDTFNFYFLFGTDDRN